MGQRYKVSRDAHTPTGGNDSLTIITASGRRSRLINLNVTGQGTSTAAQRFIVSRSTAGTTPGGAITPSKSEHTEQPAANFTTATTWSAQPTPETNGETIGWSAFGGVNRLPTEPGRPNGIIEARNGECISIRAPSGPTYQPCSFSVTIEED